jgi:hypothetical protein
MEQKPGAESSWTDIVRDAAHEFMSSVGESSRQFAGAIENY